LYNTVRVVVQQPSGQPLSGAQLVLYTGQRQMAYGTTGADGGFVFGRVPQGTYGVQATPPNGYVLLESLIRTAPTTFVDNLIVANDTLAPVHFTFLKQGPGTVVAHVVGAGNQPLDSVAAVLYSPSAIVSHAVTNAQGNVEFDGVPFGVYGVEVLRPVFYRDFRSPGDSAGASRDGIIVDQGARDSVAFALPRCSGTLNVLVTAGAGVPVAGATAVLYTSDGDVSREKTDSTGHAAFAAPCVIQFGARVEAPPGFAATHSSGQGYVDGLTLAPGASRDVTLRLQRAP
ncbi:MAG: MSCRAMM family protein, partial [Gemmatimonadaceae bacterium]